MPKVVVVGGFIQCSHRGLTRIHSGNPKLKIGGAAVVTQGQETGYAFLALGSPTTPDQPAPCTQPPDATGPSPCLATLAATQGVSDRIKVDGTGALLDTATGPATNRTDTAAKWNISDPGQTLLSEA